jgi:hypothetical protein
MFASSLFPKRIPIKKLALDSVQNIEPVLIHTRLLDVQTCSNLRGWSGKYATVKHIRGNL